MLVFCAPPFFRHRRILRARFWASLLAANSWLHVGTTLGRLIASFLMALIPGTVLGLAMGWWMGMRTAADPLVRLLFPIPSIAFFPLVIFYRGLSEWGLLLTAAITPFLLITMQSASAVESLERTLLEAGRNYGASGRRLFLRVILPASLPRLFIGNRLALGVGFIVTVAVEMVAAKHGLGGFLWYCGESRASKRCTLD